MIQLQLNPFHHVRPLHLNAITAAAGTLLIAIASIISGCDAQPVPTVAPSVTEDARPTATPLPPPPEWREASEPITLENIVQLERLGVLSVPEGSGTIYGYAVSPDNTQLAALNESWLLAWDLISGEPLFRTTRQGESQLFYSPAKDELYGLVSSGGVYIYDSTTGTEIGALPPPIGFSESGFSGAFDFHHDSASLALGLENGDIIVWNLMDPQEPLLLTHSGAASRVFDLTFSADGEALAAVYGLEQDNRVWLWNWRENSRLTDVELGSVNPSDPVTDLELSPDGRFLVGAGMNHAVIWDMATGALLHQLALQPGSGGLLFQFIPESHLLLTGGAGSNIQLWDVERGTIVATLPDTESNPETLTPIGAAASPDGQLMFTAKLDQPVILWNLANLASGNIARSAQPFGSSSIFDILWTSDNFSVLMIDARGPVEVWGIP